MLLHQLTQVVRRYLPLYHYLPAKVASLTNGFLFLAVGQVTVIRNGSRNFLFLVPVAVNPELVGIRLVIGM